MQDLLRPTLPRFLIAIIVAFIGFWLPQEVPLEWYPLDNPGDEILYLEFKCVANVSGEVRIAYATAGDFAPVNVIRWPIAPTRAAYTYTFPLPDAPITALRLEPPGPDGVLTFDSMRIATRGGREIRRFSAPDFVGGEKAESVAHPDGRWSIRTKSASGNPVVAITLPAPVVAKGANLRNLTRCLLSTGYLTMMLSIGLLAVLFATYRAPRAADLFRRIGFVIALAGLFALVANRGLIRNSCRFAAYDRAESPPRQTLRLDRPGNDGISFGPHPQVCLSRVRIGFFHRQHA